MLREWCVLEMEMLWADMVDSWIASSGGGRFTPSEEHRMLMPVKTVTISLPQMHISCCLIRRGNNLGDWWGFKWGELTRKWFYGWLF